jgi:hypothetical protein
MWECKNSFFILLAGSPVEVDTKIDFGLKGGIKTHKQQHSWHCSGNKPINFHVAKFSK